VVPTITSERLRQFKFTNLNDPDVYYDENIRRMVDNYRNVYATTAEALVEAGEAAEAKALLDTLMTAVPFETIPGDERSFLFMARAYQMVGDKDRVIEIMQKAEPVVLHRLANVRTQSEQEYVEQFVQMIRFTYLDARNFEAAAAFNNRIAEVLGESFRQTPEELRREFEGLMQDSTTTPPEIPSQGVDAPSP
jgi:hypothetical protein